MGTPMKLPRRRYWVPLVLVVLLFLCVRFGLDYHFLALVRGDAYYRGMPTSFWRDVSSSWVLGNQQPPHWLARLLRRPLPDRGPFAIFQRDPDAQKVLLQLALDQATDHDIRVRAFESCSGPALGK